MGQSPNPFIPCSAPLLLVLALVPQAAAQDLAAVTWTGSLMRIDATTGTVLQTMSLFPTLNEVNSAARTPDGTGGSPPTAGRDSSSWIH